MPPTNPNAEDKQPVQPAAKHIIDFLRTMQKQGLFHVNPVRSPSDALRRLHPHLKKMQIATSIHDLPGFGQAASQAFGVLTHTLVTLVLDRNQEPQDKTQPAPNQTHSQEQLIEVITHLVEAMAYWARECDGMPCECIDAYNRAASITGHLPLIQEDEP